MSSAGRPHLFCQDLFPDGCCGATPPVRFRPRFDLHSKAEQDQRFLQPATGTTRCARFAALPPLSLYSQRLIHDLVNHDGFEFDHRQNGKLILHRDRKSFESSRRLLKHALSYPARQLSIAAARTLAEWCGQHCGRYP